MDPVKVGYETRMRLVDVLDSFVNASDPAIKSDINYSLAIIDLLRSTDSPLSFNAIFVPAEKEYITGSDKWDGVINLNCTSRMIESVNISYEYTIPFMKLKPDFQHFLRSEINQLAQGFDVENEARELIASHHEQRLKLERVLKELYEYKDDLLALCSKVNDMAREGMRDSEFTQESERD